ncbi:MAG: hypothetical protein KZQ80_14580 [Candidatus Thiodiazotropha sp. (ex Monitilora ramsayi)]|nr:hypothetical protein [Candidatus Thiodiazotropha sp. (ex Monitilora ramsayi)]
MSDKEDGNESEKEFPDGGNFAKVSRGALQAAGGLIPFAGGVLSAFAGAWSEKEQEEVNKFFKYWVQGLEDELKEKETTLIEIMARLDLQDEEIAKRVESKEYQSIVRKTFRDWSAAESENKREYVRNILANAAACSVSSDDVVRMFFDWIDKYSDMHFQVIASVYNSNGISRGEIWRRIGRERVREDSADADVYKLLIRDLSTGGIIRQHRERDYNGNPIPKKTVRRPKGSGPKPPVSAFDEEELYELTDLGQQFIHYAMTDLPIRIEYKHEQEEEQP